MSVHAAAEKLRVGDAAGGLAACDAVLAASPDDVEALHLRAMALGRLGRSAEADAAFARAASVHPQRAAVVGNWANSLWREGRLDEAAKRYREALEADPASAPARFGLALCLQSLGELAAAEAEFGRLLDAAPRHSGAWNAKGLLALKRGDDTAAHAHFSAAIEADPGAPAALVNRGALRARGGDPDGALEDLNRACAIGAGLGEAFFERASVRRSAGQVEAALGDYFEALKRAPFRPDFHRDYAGMRWESGDRAGFLQAIDAALARQPGAELLVVRSSLCLRAGDADAAEAAARQALDLAPHAPAPARSLGAALNAKGDHEQAAAAFRRSFEAEPEAFAVRHDYAEALLGAGRFDEAERVLDVEAPEAHVQRHMALQALAWRAAGDGRHHAWFDYDRFTQKTFIDVPPGYESLEVFNAELAAAIERLHRTQVQPLDQTLYGGTQSAGRLWNERDPAIRALAAALLDAGRRFVAQLPDDPDHPFLRRKTDGVRLAGAWSVRLTSGGGHVDHMHPAGWISASYYVQVPRSVMDGERAGWLRLGASGVRGLELEAERWFKPEPGAIVFFPSFMWHGVEPFDSDEIRVTAPFDLVPQQGSGA